MHKIISGVANRSYGIQVAKMAGMPSSVVARAESVLGTLESSSIQCATQTSAHVQQKQKVKNAVSDGTKSQLNLFG